jgi:uncharacterized protein (TIGR00106 family)
MVQDCPAHRGLPAQNGPDRLRRSGLGWRSSFPEPHPRAGHRPKPTPAVAAMKVIAELCILPLGVGPSLAPYVAACERLLRQAGLDEVVLHANGTSVVGEWRLVAEAIEACHQAVHATGCARIHTVVTINSRTDRDQTLAEKVAAVEALLDPPES